MTDRNYDGICDNPFIIDSTNVDLYPLAGWLSYFGNAPSASVLVVSNSKIDEFNYSQSNNCIRLVVSKSFFNQSYGFCRVRIPHSTLNSSNLSVIIDKGDVSVLNGNYTLYDNTTHLWIYFAYLSSEEDMSHEILIVPEFAYWTACFVFCGCSLIALLQKRFQNFTHHKDKIVMTRE